MARPLRIERVGGWYHITARGNDRATIFSDERDRNHLCELLAETTQRYRWVLHAYVFMQNHYHLLIETPQPILSRAMQWLNTSYSVWYNRRHQRTGHLFEGRFKSILVEPQTWALHLSAYIHLNPVRTRRLGLDKRARARQRVGVDEAPGPEEIRQRIQLLRSFRWSSYPAYLGARPAPQWLHEQRILEMIGPGSSARRREAYQSYVERQVREGMPESPWEQLVGQTLLGSKRFIRELMSKFSAKRGDLTGAKRLETRTGWDQIVHAIEKIKKQKWETFRDQYGDWGRDLAFYLGRRDAGLTLKQLGEAAGGVDFRTVSWAIAQFEKRLPNNKHLGKLIANIRCTTQNPEL